MLLKESKWKNKLWSFCFDHFIKPLHTSNFCDSNFCERVGDWAWLQINSLGGLEYFYNNMLLSNSCPKTPGNHGNTNISSNVWIREFIHLLFFIVRGVDELDNNVHNYKYFVTWRRLILGIKMSKTAKFKSTKRGFWSRLPSCGRKLIIDNSNFFWINKTIRLNDFN